MENFSYLTISAPLTPNAIIPMPANSTFHSLTAVIKDPTGKLPNVTQCTSKASWEGHQGASWEHQQRTSVPQSGIIEEQNPLHCSVYRPWFSPYSYFVCSSTDSLPVQDNYKKNVLGDDMEIQEDRDQHETSLSSSSSSLPLSKQPWDQKPKTSPVSKDRISTQDILKACGTLEPTGSGYSCASCCRLYPSLHTLYRHIRNGRREGYSCKVFYRALKYFWERESEVGSMDNSYNEILMEENRGEHKHLEAE